MSDPDIIDLKEQLILFGLPAQGHIPTIQRMLSEGKSWKEIGDEIGWCPETAKKHYEHWEKAHKGEK